MNQNELLRKKSGSVDSNDDLAAVFYTLMINGDVSPGRLEQIIREHVNARDKNGEGGKLTCQYSNGWVAQYAINLSERLRAKES